MSSVTVSVPLVIDNALFDAGADPHLRSGQKLALVVDYNGNAGTAAADLTLVLTFEEG